MKLTDQPDAKIQLWVRNRRVVKCPRIANLPRFGHKKFNSHHEFNAWKEAMLLDLVKNGGAKWMP